MSLAFITILLWLINFLSLLTIYFINSWLPSMLKGMGLPTSTAILAATMFQVGGIAGALGSGPLVTRYGTEKVVSAMLAMGACWLVLLGATNVTTTLLIVFIFGAGIGISAGQLGINALPGAIYPPQFRNTGSGWSLGIGRLGNIGGPLLGGQLLALGWAPKSRPVGLGLMGLHDALQHCGIPFASREAVKLGSQLSEAIAFNAYWASTELAEERGRYSTFKGSLWDRGILPQDSLSLLSDARTDGNHIAASWESLSLLGPEWDELRQRIAKHGMRNSNCMAVAPTATISNIIGVSACIEPIFENLFVKSNMSGEFTVINENSSKLLLRLCQEVAPTEP